MNEKDLNKTPQTEDDAQAPAANSPLSDEDRMKEDIRTLRTLFPALTPEEIPEEVWQKVSEGESLAAAYALHFLKQLKEKERIEKHNLENEKKALPRLKSDRASEEYYSPETVRAMSPAEVRRHYAAILKSMDSWN